MSELGEEIKGFGEGEERQKKDQYHLITPQLWHLFSFSFSILFFPLLKIHSLKLQPSKDTLISYISFSIVCTKQSCSHALPTCYAYDPDNFFRQGRIAILCSRMPIK